MKRHRLAKKAAALVLCAACLAAPCAPAFAAVSYTHLDVYKRQPFYK